MSADAILSLNAGSSSLKFALFEMRGSGLAAVLRGQIESIGTAPHLRATGADGAVIAEQDWDRATPQETMLRAVLDLADRHLGADRLRAAGHRIVHGGTRFTAPARVDDEVLRAMDALTPLAPLHQPHNLAPIRTLRAMRPGLAQVASFDTAFHAAMPDEAARLALPRALSEAGIRRYGFHGISYEYIAGALPADLAAGRVVVAHLGNGASLCAMRAGHSVDTTMSFTALDGLVMGTRPGALDPGVVTYLIRERGMSAEQVEDVLYHRSGLLGVSGVSGDMRTLLASADPHAKQAVALFVAGLARETGAMAAALGGLDGLVFTAGIGEHAVPIREAACARLEWLGLRVDQAANRRGAGRISAEGSPVQAWVIPTNEELVVARHAAEVLNG